MLNSMTGFGGVESKLKPAGKISVEIRSTNHKFLEIVLHVPEGFMSLEDKIKKEIEAKLKRGRVVCSVNINGAQSDEVFINKKLLKKYVSAVKNIQAEFSLKNGVSVDALIKLPGVLALEEKNIEKAVIWPQIKGLLLKALEDLSIMRRKEGRVLQTILIRYACGLKGEIESVRKRFKKAVSEKTTLLKSDEERSSFLKDSDITEEIERLFCHTSSLLQKLNKPGPVGKELDFIAQEMQREANTIGAKSCDTLISAKVVQMKSQIEKIREQVQNIE